MDWWMGGRSMDEWLGGWMNGQMNGWVDHGWIGLDI